MVEMKANSLEDINNNYCNICMLHDVYAGKNVPLKWRLAGQCLNRWNYVMHGYYSIAYADSKEELKI